MLDGSSCDLARGRPGLLCATQSEQIVLRLLRLFAANRLGPPILRLPFVSSCETIPNGSIPAEPAAQPYPRTLPNIRLEAERQNGTVRP
jgi:hypothetical protein